MRSPRAAAVVLRSKVPLLDHLVRAVGRYQADAGDRLAAAVTFYWFLSLFPVLLIAIYLFRLVNGDSAVSDVRQGLSGYLPAQLVETISTTIGENAGTAGVLGLLGLLLAGLGWIDALREAIRSIWHQQVIGGHMVLRRGIDVLVLLGLLGTVGVSVFVTGLASSGPRFLLEQLGVDPSRGSELVLKLVGVLVTALTDIALFLYLFVRLARVRTSVREVLAGAVFGAAGFGVLKVVGGYYVQRTTTRGEATYGTFAVVVGLLLFLNLVSRLVLLSAAFAVTGPYDSDTRPSGTAARVGAPLPVQDVPEGRIAPRGEPEGVRVEQSWSARRPPPPPAEAAEPVRRSEPEPVAVPLNGAAQVQLAGRATSALLGLALVGAGIYVLRTVRGLLRR